MTGHDDRASSENDGSRERAERRRKVVRGTGPVGLVTLPKLPVLDAVPDTQQSEAHGTRPPGAVPLLPSRTSVGVTGITEAAPSGRATRLPKHLQSLPLDTPPSRGQVGNHEIRRRVLSGLIWGIASSGAVQVAQLCTSIVLVRLLSPQDYGLAGMALLFQGIVVMVADLSMGAALIQRREITEADRSTVFWCTAAVGGLLTAGGIALSGPLADFYNQPAVRPLFAVLSTSFVLTALQVTPQALLDREMQFRLIYLRLGVSSIIGSMTALAAGFLGTGAWALIFGQVATSASGLLFIWASCSWRPRFLFSWNSLKDLGGYGIRLCGANLLSYTTANVDNLMVGRFLGSAALGIYSVAFNLMFLPISRVITPVQLALFPAFARWQDEHGEIANLWLRLLRVVGAGFLPAMLGFVVVAPDFVNVVLGRKWQSAAPVLQLLAAIALAQGLALVGQRVLAAVDRTRTVLRFGVLNTLAVMSAIAVGLHWGVVGVSVCYAAVSVPLQVFYVHLTARAIALSIRTVVRALLGVLSACTVMVASCLMLRAYLVGHHIDAPLRLAAVAAVGTGVYAIACSVVAPDLLGEIRSFRAQQRIDEALPRTA